MIKISTKQTTNDLLERIEEMSGQNIYGCYQCGTCSSGCPFIQTMDIHPHMVMRHLMYGLPGVLESKTIWLCVSCFMCAERCPRDIDIARVMEALRQTILRGDVDYTRLSGIPIHDLEGIPQIALVSHLRKNTG